jgi:hypothetical protein
MTTTATAPTVASVGNVHRPRMRSQKEGVAGSEAGTRDGTRAFGDSTVTAPAFADSRMRACTRAGTGRSSNDPRNSWCVSPSAARSALHWAQPATCASSASRVVPSASP